jgi:hypothetical protein
MDNEQAIADLQRMRDIYMDVISTLRQLAPGAGTSVWDAVFNDRYHRVLDHPHRRQCRRCGFGDHETESCPNRHSRP